MKRPSEEVRVAEAEAPLLPDDVLELVCARDESDSSYERDGLRGSVLPLLSCCRAYRAFFERRGMALVVLEYPRMYCALERYIEQCGTARPRWIRAFLLDALCSQVLQDSDYALAALCCRPMRVPYFLRSGWLVWNTSVDSLLCALFRWPQALDERNDAEWRDVMCASAQAEWDDEVAWRASDPVLYPMLGAFQSYRDAAVRYVEKTLLAAPDRHIICNYNQGEISCVPLWFDGLRLASPWGADLDFDHADWLAIYLSVLYFYSRRNGGHALYASGSGGGGGRLLTVDRLFLALDAHALEHPAQAALLAPLLNK